MEYPLCRQSIGKKDFLVNLPRKKVSFSIGNFDLFAYSIFKNIEISSGQGVVQSEPNRYPRLPVLFWFLCEKNGPPNFPRKKVSFTYGKLQLFRLNCNY